MKRYLMEVVWNKEDGELSPSLKPVESKNGAFVKWVDVSEDQKELEQLREFKDEVRKLITRKIDEIRIVQAIQNKLRRLKEG